MISLFSNLSWRALIYKQGSAGALLVKGMGTHLCILRVPENYPTFISVMVEFSASSLKNLGVDGHIQLEGKKMHFDFGCACNKRDIIIV